MAQAIVSDSDPRTEKAQVIAAGAGQWLRGRLNVDGRKVYGIRSCSNPNVVYWANKQGCTCPDRKHREQPCKHQIAVQIHCAAVKLAEYVAAFGEPPLPEPAPEPQPISRYDRIFGTDETDAIMGRL